MSKKKDKNNVVELFGGVGGFSLGLEKSGWKTIFFNQWEPSTKRQDSFDCYNFHYPDCNNSNVDVSTLSTKDIPDHTLLVGGFPCQDYSVMKPLSSSKGIEGKKGVLWWEIRRIVEDKRPRFVLLENVDRLIKSPSTQRGRDFGIIISCMNSLGYSVEWRVINSGDYGFPQRRRRTFIFCSNDKKVINKLYGDKDGGTILTSSGFFPSTFECKKFDGSDTKPVDIPTDLVDLTKNFQYLFGNCGYSIDFKCRTTKVVPVYNGEITTLGDILEKGVDEKYYIKEKDLPDWEYMKGGKKEKRITSEGYEYDYSEGPIPYPDYLDKPSRTLLTSESGKNRMTHIVRDPETGRIRKLTPVECERLDGFPDNWTNTGMSEKFRYFCMGNALVVGLIEKMGHQIQRLNK